MLLMVYELQIFSLCFLDWSMVNKELLLKIIVQDHFLLLPMWQKNILATIHVSLPTS